MISRRCTGLALLGQGVSAPDGALNYTFFWPSSRTSPWLERSDEEYIHSLDHPQLFRSEDGRRIGKFHKEDSSFFSELFKHPSCMIVNFVFIQRVYNLFSRLIIQNDTYGDMGGH